MQDRPQLMIPQLGKAPDAPFPACDTALPDPDGLLAWGGDLHPQRLLRAYRRGIFPWYSQEQPILWWCPARRAVLFPEQVHVSRRLARRLRQGRYTVTADRAFEDVIDGCARPRHGQPGTWITREMRKAYVRLHHAGHAHSVEVWDGKQLAGGLYGLAMGTVVFGESMFSAVPDASKIALVTLCLRMQEHGYRLLDCQVHNAHLQSMGAMDLSRERFLNLLDKAVAAPAPGFRSMFVTQKGRRA